MANFSFDIVSELDKAELNNVFDQTKREMVSRYDFKNTPADIEWLNEDKTGIKITGNSDYQIDAILDIFRKKLSSRELSQKILDVSKDSTTTNLKTVKEVSFKKGLDQTKTKELGKIIRDELPKVKPLIQGETLRVTSSSKDDLQTAISLVRSKDLDYPIQFTNFH